MIRVVLITVALLLAAAAGWMVKLYLSGQRAQLAEMAANMKPQPMPTDEVLVAASALEITAMVSRGNLRWQSWPQNDIDSHYIIRKTRPDAIEKLAGSAARQPLYAGEPITEAKLILKQDGGFLAAVLDNGGRAIALRVDDASGVAGLVLPGDHIDVILTHEVPTREDDGRGGTMMTKRHVSETIVHDLTVLAVDQDLKHGDKTAAKIGKTVTVAVNDAQAEAVALGRVMGTLTLTLRSSFGNDMTSTRGPKHFTSSTDISDALRELSAPPPPKVSAAPPPVPPYTITVFRGSVPETVTLAR